MMALTLKNVRKKFGDLETIRGINLDIKEGEFIVFVGPSGCGKSTLLRLIAGLETLTDGEINIDGVDVSHAPSSKRGLAMVFQSYALYPHMTVEENLSFSMRMRKCDKLHIKTQVEKAINTLQLEPYMHRKPKELSGGQCQRVAIGRAIVQNPKIFLFDEPLSNLDAELRVKMRVEISALHKKLGNTMIYVTHDQVEAMTLADRIVVLRAGKIEQVGKPLELYHYPDNMFVAGFIGSPKINFVPVTVNQVNSSSLAIKLDAHSIIEIESDTDNCNVGDTITLGIRPEHLIVADESNFDFKLDITLMEKLGGVTYVHGLIKDNNFCFHSADEIDLNAGDCIYLKMDSKQVHLFDVDGNTLTNQVKHKHNKH